MLDFITTWGKRCFKIGQLLYITKRGKWYYKVGQFLLESGVVLQSTNIIITKYTSKGINKANFFLSFKRLQVVCKDMLKDM